MAVWRLPVKIAHTVLGPDGGVNVWHFRTTDESGPVAATERDAAAASIRKFYESLCGLGTAPGQVLANGTVVTADSAQQVDTDNVQSVAFASLTVPDAAATAPPSMCITVNWKTSSASRRGRGRTFVGPLLTGHIESNGTPNPATLTNVRNAAGALRDRNLLDNGWAIGVWGLVNAGGVSTAPHVLRDITSYTVKDHYTWLRSRGN